MLQAKPWGIHSITDFLWGIVIREALRYDAIVEALMEHPVFEAEVLAQLLSCMILVLDVPALLFQFSVDVLDTACDHGVCKVLVILPYGSVYFSRSLREFWTRWSRPATSLIRQMVYYPVGGPRRPWLSIPLLFALNCSSHYDVGKALTGDRAEKWWNVVFGILGFSATGEVIATNFMRRRLGDDIPLWFRLSTLITAHISLRFAGYFFLHGCLKMNLASFVPTP